MNTKEEEPQVKSYKITNLDLFTLSEVLKKCVNTGLSPDSFIGFINFSMNLEKLIENRVKAIKILMNSYGIAKPVHLTPNTMQWAYQKHEKAAEIKSKLDAINNHTVELTPSNFIPASEFNAFTAAGRLSMDRVLFLSKILMKNG